MKSLLNWCKRYIKVIAIIIIAFIAYAFFFQENSLPKYLEYKKTIDSLETAIENNRDTMILYRDLNHRLSTDPRTIERIVREDYNMVKPGEDIYKFEDESQSTK